MVVVCRSATVMAWLASQLLGRGRTETIRLPAPTAARTHPNACAGGRRRSGSEIRRGVVTTLPHAQPGASGSGLPTSHW